MNPTTNYRPAATYCASITGCTIEWHLDWKLIDRDQGFEYTATQLKDLAAVCQHEYHKPVFKGSYLCHLLQNSRKATNWRMLSMQSPLHNLHDLVNQA